MERFNSFTYGQVTPVDKMPQLSGKATYQGTSYYASEKGKFETSANFTADFSAKTLNGTITNSAKGVSLTLPQATISGNTFTGGGRRGGTVFFKEAFYGNNAEEIGGIYGNDRVGFVGSFGAVKK